MAVTEIRVEAPAGRCFEVLSDPRSFAYWVVGSRKIRAADPAWPAAGSAFDHTVGFGPFRAQDHTEVEEVREDRLLVLRAKARPFGTARVRMELEPSNGGTRVRMQEEPADRMTRLFFGATARRLLVERNAKALERFKELAEGSVPIPGGELPTREDAGVGTDGAPGQGEIGARPEGSLARAAAGFGRGAAAGLVGAAAMSVSTNAEMRLSNRAPSEVPARALSKLLGIRRLGSKGERRLTAASHVLVSCGLGGVRGALSGVGIREPYGTPLLLAISLTPDFAAMPALGVAPPPWRWSKREVAISVLHHGVFTAATAWALSRLES